MKALFVCALCALFSGCLRSNQNLITSTEAEELVQLALSNDLAIAKKRERRVCVQRELDQPLHDIRNVWKTMGAPPPTERWGAWSVGEKRLDEPSARKLDAALRDAVLGRGSDAPIDKVPNLTSPLLLFSNDKVPAECDTTPARDGGPYVTYLSRPVVAHGYAFIEHAGVCGGLCGRGSLLAFRKQGNRWVEVGMTPTWVS